VFFLFFFSSKFVTDPKARTIRVKSQVPFFFFSFSPLPFIALYGTLFVLTVAAAAVNALMPFTVWSQLANVPFVVVVVVCRRLHNFDF